MLHPKSRHTGLVITLIAASACATGSGVAQTIKHRLPAPPASAQDDSDKKEQTATDAQAARKAQLAQTDKAFREGVDRLCKLSNELREEVQKTPPSGVLSVSMYKKMEAIEKLAKSLKHKAKGG